jgi:LuxR family maltose regulon positive regulatory protein
MAAGLGDAAIAEALVASLATAKWHAAHVRAKLGARSRTQALARARELGMV